MIWGQGTAAAVDIGSNSVRLLVVDADLEDLHRESNVTGLARGVDAGGVISDEAIAETVDVIARYAAIIERHGVEVVGAVATSASRDATNGPRVMERLSEALGVEPMIIVGRKEASRAFAGATSHLAGSHERIVIDIGGGSTEIIEGVDDVSWAHSYDIGSVRITDRHLTAKPSSAEAVSRAEQDARAVFAEPRAPGASDAEAIGVAGSFANLAAIALGLPEYDSAAVHGSVLTRSQVSELIDRFTGLSLEELRAVPAMHPKRAPVMLGGAIVARASMDAVGAPHVVVSAHGLLDGLARDLMRSRCLMSDV